MHHAIAQWNESLYLEQDQIHVQRLPVASDVNASGLMAENWCVAVLC